MSKHQFMKRLLVITIMLAGTFFLVASANPNQVITISLTKTNPIYTITLPSNPTAGYRWVIQSYNANLLQLVRHQYIASTSQLMGAGGHEIFQFKVLPIAFNKVQVLSIVLIYKRPWEKTVAQTKIFIINIK